jgi:hypothetical protein
MQVAKQGTSLLLLLIFSAIQLSETEHIDVLTEDKGFQT